MTTSNKPRKAQPHGNTDNSREAWWYENAKSIDVYVNDKKRGVTLACTIGRAALKRWLERTETA